jgi:hypothetical protein
MRRDAITDVFKDVVIEVMGDAYSNVTPHCVRAWQHTRRYEFPNGSELVAIFALF